jgi:hypothetical protein
MTSTTTTIPASTDGASFSTRTLVRGGAIGTGLALAANLVVWLVGHIGAPTRVVTGWAPDGEDLSIANVVVTTVVLVLLGAALLWVLERRRADAFRIWVIVAAVFAVASIPPVLRLDIDGGSKLALAAMHLATGAAAIAGQAIVRRR